MDEKDVLIQALMEDIKFLKERIEELAPLFSFCQRNLEMSPQYELSAI